jgi:hypothetical protein
LKFSSLNLKDFIMPIIDPTQPIDSALARTLPEYIREGRVAQQDIYDNASTILAGEVFPELLTVNSTTPILQANSSYYTNNTVATAVTNFSWPSTPTEGKTITIVINDNNTSFVHSGDLVLISDADTVASISDVFTFVYMDATGGTSSSWYQVNIAKNQIDDNIDTAIAVVQAQIDESIPITITLSANTAYTIPDNRTFVRYIRLDATAYVATIIAADALTQTIDGLALGVAAEGPYIQNEITEFYLVGTDWKRF